MEPQMKVLILGGTNFMGKALLDVLSKLQSPPLVVCVNRGKIYWNNQARKEHPEVATFYCDRKQHKDTTATVAFLSQHLQITPENKWTCVVDFSAFRWRDVQSVTKAIQHIAERYIFISSDSVYNSHATPFKGPIKEEDIDLQAEYKAIKGSTRSKDTYGYNKLKCELYLQRIHPLPYICLRLPDVIGPFDNTSRFWCTLKWIAESSKYELPITVYDERTKLSFVDSISVAEEIVKIMQMGEVPSKAYNLCSRETITNKEMIDQIAASIGVITPNCIAERNSESSFFYPSVQCGIISCQRAEREIGWNPMPLSQAIRTTAEFFHFKGSSYRDELKEMDKDFRKKVVNRKKGGD